MKAFLRLIFTSLLISTAIITLMHSRGATVRRVNSHGTKRQKDTAHTSRSVSIFSTRPFRYSDVVADREILGHETHAVDRTNVSTVIDIISPVLPTPLSDSPLGATTNTVPSSTVKPFNYSYVYVADRAILGHETHAVDQTNVSTGIDIISSVLPTSHSDSAIRATTNTVPSSSMGSKLAIIGEYEYYRRRDIKVNAFNHRISLGPRRQSVCLNDTFMVILVHSHPSYLEKRQAIRRTWGRPIEAPREVTWPHDPSCCSGIRLLFVVGENEQFEAAIRDEQAQYDDILQGDFVDSYRNLTLKSLFGLKVVAELCPNVKYLVKSDDDMFIHVPFMLERLEKRQLRRSIMGPLIRSGVVQRTGKWAVTDEEFPFTIFPPYMTGAAYVITRDIVGELLELSDYVPYLGLCVDDVYVTGILGRILNVTLVGGKTSLEFAHVLSRAARACDIISRRVMTSTRMTPSKLTKIWNRLHELDFEKRKIRGNCG